MLGAISCNCEYRHLLPLWVFSSERTLCWFCVRNGREGDLGVALHNFTLFICSGPDGVT